MLKHTIIFHSLWLTFTFCVAPIWGFLKPERTWLEADVVTRLITLRQFVPQKHYRWHMRWICNGVRQYSTLEGLQQGQAHWITITFASEKSLTFDKSRPCIALYPNKLCIVKPEAFTMPLQDLPGVCIHTIAMPFLSWDIVNCSKTAKLGRRAIKVLLSEHKPHTITIQSSPILHTKALQDLRTEIFLDKHFNTILQAQMWDTQKNFRAGFTLKHLKKFKSGWGLQSAEFTLNNHKATLYVDEVESLN